MTANNPLPTPSASASATPSSGSAATAAASASQTTDPAAAAAAAGQPAPGAQQQQQPSPAEAIEILVQQILASNNDAALAGTLLNSLGTPEVRESVLASATPAGADPLDALDAARHTIGILFILCVLLFLSFTFFRPSFPPATRHFSRPRIGMPSAQTNHMLFPWMCLYCSLWLAVTYRSFVSSFVFCRLGRPGTSPDRSARLTSTSTTAPAVPFAHIQKFCQNLNSEAVRHAPERGESLALRALPLGRLASRSDVWCPLCAQ